MKKFRSFSHDVEELLDIGFLQYDAGVSSVEDLSLLEIDTRWISIRSDTTLREFNRILFFVQDVHLLAEESRYIHKKMYLLLSWLERSKKNHVYIKVLSVVTKYLDGIKRFLSKNFIEGLPSYRQLFEGVFIAIIHETRFIELELY